MARGEHDHPQLLRLRQPRGRPHVRQLIRGAAGGRAPRHLPQPLRLALRREDWRLRLQHVAVVVVEGEARAVELHGAVPRLVVERDHVAARLPRGAHRLVVHVAALDPRALGVDARELLLVEGDQVLAPLAAHLEDFALAQRDHLGAHAPRQLVLVLVADLVGRLAHRVQVGDARQLRAHLLLVLRARRRRVASRRVVAQAVPAEPIGRAAVGLDVARREPVLLHRLHRGDRVGRRAFVRRGGGASPPQVVLHPVRRLHHVAHHVGDRPRAPARGGRPRDGALLRLELLVRVTQLERREADGFQPRDDRHAQRL
mmetsp:Transcript_40756/g.101242  ORF Transcript_40756/g.101242 Transcript_40756/m.101242 type:complete len:314 (+) Transcript_40756:1142-2083(+)